MIFPGIITGCIVLPYYEMNYGMYYVNSFFNEDTKYNYGVFLFMGCFLAIYFFWVNSKTRIDFAFDKFGNWLTALNGINVFVLMFSYYLARYPVRTFVGGIFFFIILMITISIANQIKEFIYILVMFYFMYYSFLVLPIENGSWDIVGLMQKINRTNIKELYLEDEWYVKGIKHLNNFIFTSPLVLIFTIVTLCEMGTVSNANLPDPSWIKTSMYMFLTTVFIMCSFYSIFQYMMFWMNTDQNNTFNIMENISSKKQYVSSTSSYLASGAYYVISEFPKIIPIPSLNFMLNYGPIMLALGAIMCIYLVPLSK
jgi:hypothetical protein